MVQPPSGFCIVDQSFADYLARCEDLRAIEAVLGAATSSPKPAALQRYLDSLHFVGSGFAPEERWAAATDEHEDVTFILDTIREAYGSSPTFRAAVNGFAARDDMPISVIDIEGKRNLHYFQENRTVFNLDDGTLKYGPGYDHHVPARQALVLHEVFHSLTGLGDGQSVGTRAAANLSALIDPGPVVVLTNLVLEDMQLQQDIRITYLVPAQGGDSTVSSVMTRAEAGEELSSIEAAVLATVHNEVAGPGWSQAAFLMG
ncbi:hypothetical protein FHS85_001798 [Rhodoligotrophos appendicifer]|uniref:hypothetical protein n=1 Tax=Rhodoligotrophos appendicifer TaxID=987056 RepID=UPI001186C6EB|nr:hypothetical protein [Rhodoligotrophos appendicifer]